MKSLIALCLIFLLGLSSLAFGQVDFHFDHSHISESKLYTHSHHDKQHESSRASDSADKGNFHLHFHSPVPLILISFSAQPLLTVEEIFVSDILSFDLYLASQFETPILYRPPIV